MNAERKSFYRFRESLITAFVCAAVFLSPGSPIAATSVNADITVPTKTRITFLSGGKLIDGEIKFKVSCLGWPCHPGEQDCSAEGAPKNAPPVAEVYSFSATCASSPCEINESFYLNYIKLESCNMKGETKGKPFEIKNYSKTPVDFQKCTNDKDGNRNCELSVAIPE